MTHALTHDTLLDLTFPGAELVCREFDVDLEVVASAADRTLDGDEAVDSFDGRQVRLQQGILVGRGGRTVGAMSVVVINAREAKLQGLAHGRTGRCKRVVRTARGCTRGEDRPA